MDEHLSHRTTRHTSSEFAHLFRHFRLHSGFRSLQSLADAFADEGHVYEPSLFSHWQRGARVPTQRHVILDLINIFVKYGSITSREEANSLCQSAHLGYLSDKELELFPELFLTESKSLTPTTIFVSVGKHIAEILQTIQEEKGSLSQSENITHKTSVAFTINIFQK